MKEDTNILKEIELVTDAPIRVKNDTLEYNAASFKVRPDANVEALLKQLPGVEIDAEKNITVNGKKVSQILVNGKPFFNADGSIALQNLPANLIKKIQVSDFKTKAEQFQGTKGKSQEATINLTMDEKDNQGFLGKLMAGYGTDNRYESSGLINYFKGARKISVLASSNNINSTGFSMDEIFDNMGGGRSQYMRYGGLSGGFFGENVGITRSNLAGINYADEWAKDVDANASYTFNQTDNENVRRSKEVYLLPEQDFTRFGNRNSNNNNENHAFNFNIEAKINESTKVYFEPAFSYNKNATRNTFDNQAINNNGDLLNTNNGRNITDAETKNFSNEFTLNRKFKSGQNISVTVDTENNVTNSNGLAQSETRFFQNGLNDDIRNQKEDARNTNDKYATEFSFSQPITKDLSLRLEYNFDYNTQTDVNNSYNYNAIQNKYSDFNAALSNNTRTETITNTPTAALSVMNDKWYVVLKSGVEISKLNANAFYMNQQYQQTKRFMVPRLEGYGNYRIKNGKTVHFNYDFETTNPTAMQILPYEILNDPLNTYIGNPNLDQSKSHRLGIGFSNYDFQTRSGFYLGSSASYNEKDIVSITTYDENRKSTTTFTNINDTYNMNFYGNWNKSWKGAKWNTKIGINSNIGYTFEKGFVNDVLFESKGLNIFARPNATFEYGDLFVISPSYRFTYNENNYTNYFITQTHFVRHHFMLQTTNNWPKNWTFGNDFTYTYNSNISEGFRRDFFLWNTSLAYTFFNNKLTAKVKVYDILNQNTGVSRSISATRISDSENTVLRRYAMFSLTYKFDKYGTGDANAKKKRRYMIIE